MITMKGIIEFGTKKCLVQILCENNQILEVNFKEEKSGGLEKAYYYNADADADGFGNSLMEYEEFEQFYDENETLVDFIESIVDTFDLRTVTSVKIKRSIDFFEKQVTDLKDIDKNEPLSVLVRKAVDEYIENHS